MGDGDEEREKLVYAEAREFWIKSQIGLHEPVVEVLTDAEMEHFLKDQMDIFEKLFEFYRLMAKDEPIDDIVNSLSESGVLRIE